jgi:iron complex outermembrane receptor protein
MILQKMRMPSRRALALICATSSTLTPALAYAEEDQSKDILVTSQKVQQSIENTPSTRATVTADSVAEKINAVNIEDTVKYLPGLIVRKRHIGDTQAPLATRTSGLGSSARSLIYADGALLSSLIGNNNSLASPRWSLVSPQEIARIDVLYGPYSAAYGGNSIGAVVNITTRLPDTLEATATAGTSVQTFDQYGTHQMLPAWQIGATIGDRLGPLALFASVNQVISNGQPLQYVTATSQPAGTTGGYADVNRTNAPIRVLGASGLEHQRQDQFKFKAALDITPDIRLTYVGGLFLNDTDSTAESYISSGGGTTYTSAFSSGVYHYDERHWSHSLSATGAGGRFDWQVIGTLYDFDHDVQRTPTGTLPAAEPGGPGTITRLDGTGWTTLDAKGVWRSGADATHSISFGAHADWFEINSNRYATTSWVNGSEGALNLQSKGKTRTIALWAQDAWKLLPTVTLTAGGRYEGWKAYDGVNLVPPLPPKQQPRLSANNFSPKASLAWDPNKDWTLRFSFGEAYRFPTAGELYQVVTTPVAALPSPTLRPERALSEELSVERHGAQGSLRLSLFNESIRDALISQTGPLPGGQIGTYVQNVDHTRARGAELAFQQNDLVPRFDLSGSVTYADATTRADPMLPAAIGKRLPSVPRWKATAVATWRPTDQISLTIAGRYASRMYGALDNSDVIGNTYQGFYKYLVVDLRAQFRVTDHWSLGLGVDNLNNDRYFLFHPFPQRSFSADLTMKL